MHLAEWTDWRRKNPLRGSAAVLLSLAWAIWLSHFPLNRPTLWLALPALFAFAGMADTARCMQRKWSWYHGGIVLFLYMDMMAVTMILFLLIYPYW